LSDTNKKIPTHNGPAGFAFLRRKVLSNEAVQGRARPIKGAERYVVSRGGEGLHGFDQVHCCGGRHCGGVAIIGYDDQRS
jgi:hypothetical protein